MQAHGTFLGGPQPPYLAGFEAAGEIVATGKEVTGLEPGARVLGVGLGCGAFAEYTALPAVAVLPVPTGWADKEALGMVVNWPTALAALRPLGGDRRRDRVGAAPAGGHHHRGAAPAHVVRRAQDLCTVPAQPRHGVAW